MAGAQAATAIVDAPDTGRAAPRDVENLVDDALAAREPEPAPAGGPTPPVRERRGAGRQQRAGARTRPGNSGGAVGGHKPTKTELEKLARDQADRIDQLAAELEAARAAMDPAAQAAAAAMVAAMIGQALGTMSKVGARIAKAPIWALTPQEQKELGEVWQPVLAPYIARWAEDAPVVTAAFKTADILLPRFNFEGNAAQGTTAAPIETAPGVEVHTLSDGASRA